MPLYATTSDSSYCCGVIEFGRFRYEPAAYYADGPLDDVISGALIKKPAFFQAAFINNKVCKEAYNTLCQRLKLVAQTEPKINHKHGGSKKNKVFVCLFVAKD